MMMMMMMMMMMNMTKTLTEQNGFFADFSFDSQACVGATLGYQWTLQVKIRSSEQSGKNSMSFKA